MAKIAFPASFAALIAIFIKILLSILILFYLKRSYQIHDLDLSIRFSKHQDFRNLIRNPSFNFFSVASIMYPPPHPVVVPPSQTPL